MWQRLQRIHDKCVELLETNGILKCLRFKEMKTFVTFNKRWFLINGNIVNLAEQGEYSE